MNTQYDVYFDSVARCRLVKRSETPNFLTLPASSWRLGFSFFAFDGSFSPLPRNTTLLKAYFAPKYPYDTYALITSTMPLIQTHDIDLDALGLYVPFIAYSDEVINTIPIFIFERKVGEFPSLLISTSPIPPREQVFASEYTKLAISPVWVTTRPMSSFVCVNSVCIPSQLSTYPMMLYRDLERMTADENVENKTINIFRERPTDYDFEQRQTYGNIYNCIQACREPHEKAYRYKSPQDDLLRIK